MQNDRFDKFSQQARMVLALAQEEAQRLNQNHIGTEHWLVGLVRVEEGVAARVLAALGVRLEPVREALQAVAAAKPPRQEIGLTAEARRTIELAVDAARGLGHHYIGTEHLLLGLLRQDRGPAAAALDRLGLDRRRIRDVTVAMLAQSAPPAPGEPTWRSASRSAPPARSAHPARPPARYRRPAAWSARRGSCRSWGRCGGSSRSAAPRATATPR